MILLAWSSFFFDETTFVSDKPEIYQYSETIESSMHLKKILPTESETENEMLNKRDDMETLEALFMDKKAFREKILSYEDTFANNSYNGKVDAEQPFTYQNGEIPILISAPHTTKHIREGKIKDADIYTGSIALFLSELTGTHLLYTTGLSDDANYIQNGKYKEELTKVVEENNIQYVIDIHGAAKSRPFDIDLGTVHGKSLDSQTVSQIKSVFFEKGIANVLENGVFAASTSGTITNYSFNELQTQAVQIEINRKYRDPRNDLDSFYSLLQSLVEIVNHLEQ